jgi:hypothetical protein
MSATAGALAVIAVIVAGVWIFERNGRAARTPIRSLAVLPLKNVNASQSDDH